MGLLAGEKIRETDFILTAQAGENISVGQAVMVGNGTDSGAVILQVTTSDNASQVCSGTTWVAQRVRFSAVRNITHIGFRHDQQQSVPMTVRIRATLTGADLGSGTFNPGSTNGGTAYRTVALGAAVNLSPNTDYYVIFSGAYTLFGQTTSTDPNGEARVSTNSGGAWALHGTAADWGVYLVGGITEAGKIYKALDSLPNQFIGFAEETRTAAQNIRVNPQMVIHDLLTGLAAGTRYFLGPTAGVLSTTGTNLVGIAISATLFVRDYMKI